MLQMIIATLLFFVLFFGIGFILNMLLKTTWLTVYLYLMLAVILLFYYWDKGNESFWSYVSGYTFVDVLPAIGGLIGAIVSGWTIRYLRSAGYKMF